MKQSDNGIRANDDRVIAKVKSARKAQVVKTAAALGVSEAEFLRRVLDWYFEEKGKGEETLRNLAQELRTSAGETHEALQTLFPMLELMVKILLMRMPGVGPETANDREREAARLLGLWQEQLLQRLQSGQPSDILSLVSESVRSELTDLT